MYFMYFCMYLCIFVAYQQHLKTDHFQKYKQGTLHMVKDLKLPTMNPLDPETMKLIFKKQQ